MRELLWRLPFYLGLGILGASFARQLHPDLTLLGGLLAGYLLHDFSRGVLLLIESKRSNVVGIQEYIRRKKVEDETFHLHYLKSQSFSEN